MRISHIALATLAGVVVCGPAWAQPKPADPNWPCEQLLVPTLSAGSYWSGTPVPHGDTSWRDDPKLTTIVTTAVDRDTPDDEVKKDLVTYADAVPAAQRGKAVARLFGFIVDDANDERQHIIDRLDDLSQRQKNLSVEIDGISKQIDAIPENATGDAATQRAALMGQRDFNIRTFQETQHTVHYACEVPGTFDQRLGLIARTLEATVKSQ
jgi:hypothetical protein